MQKYLQDGVGTLVSHLDESSKNKFKNLSFLKVGKIPNILQNEEPRSVEVNVLKRNQNIKELLWACLQAVIFS